jgi:hypothetical protein
MSFNEATEALEPAVITPPDAAKAPQPKPVTILVNRREVEVPDDRVTGSQIKQAAGVPATFKLFDPKGTEIAQDEVVHVHNKESFTAISGQDVS